MAKKKSNVMSFSCPLEMQGTIKSGAVKMGYPSYSELLRTLVDKHLELLVHDGEYIPIKLKIPSELQGDGEAVRKWMEQATETVVKKLSE